MMSEEVSMKDSFHFLREVEKNTFVECYGIDFEDFEVGQIFEHRPGRTFTEADCLAHALRSLDLSPQYADQHYAKAVYGSRMRVMESYVFATMALSTKTFGKVVANLSMTDYVIDPVYAGDTIYFESEILSKRESKSRPEQGLLHVSTRAENQHGERVASFERKFLVYRRDLGPYAAAGY